MALSQTELVEEAQGQLRQLAQSPGWALYKARLLSLSRSKNEAKAEALRANAINDALLLQGFVDGLQAALEGPERYEERLRTGEAHLPAGSGS